MNYLHRLHEIEYQLLNDFDFQLTDAQKVMAAQNILRTVILEAKENGERVEISDLSLRPTSYFGTTIIWDETDYEKDTFTVKLGDIEVTQDVDSPLSLVIDYSDDISDWEAVNVAFQKVKPGFERETDSTNNITGFLILPTTSELDTTVTWDVSNAAGINQDGSVQRPNPGDGDAIGYLYARIEKGDKGIIKIFETKVLERKLSSAEVVALDYDWLEIGYQGSEFNLSVAHDLTLPTLGFNYAEITWTSDHPNVTDEGVVTRPLEGEAPVYGTLTAQVKSSGYVQNKVYTIKVEPEGESIKSYTLDIEDDPYDNIDPLPTNRDYIAGDHDYIAFSDPNFSNTGRVYIYRDSGTSFGQETFFEGESSEYLGRKISSNGNFVVVSSQLNDGALKIYQYHAGVWNLNQELLPEDGESFKNIDKIEFNDNFFLVFSVNNKLYLYRRYETGWERLYSMDIYTNEFSFRNDYLFTKEQDSDNNTNIVVRKRNFYDEFPIVDIINKDKFDFSETDVTINDQTPLFFDGTRLVFTFQNVHMKYSNNIYDEVALFTFNSEDVFEYEKALSSYRTSTVGGSYSDYIHNIYSSSSENYNILVYDLEDNLLVTNNDIIDVDSKTFLMKRPDTLIRTKNNFLDSTGNVYKIYKNVFDKDGRKFDYINLKQIIPAQNINIKGNSYNIVLDTEILENGDFLLIKDTNEGCNYKVYKRDVDGVYNIQVDTTSWPVLETDIKLQHNYFYTYNRLYIKIYQTDLATESISVVLDVDFADTGVYNSNNWSQRQAPYFNEDLTLFSFNEYYTSNQFYSYDSTSSLYLTVVAFFTIENDLPKYISYIQGYRYHNYENLKYFMLGNKFYNQNTKHEHPISGASDPRFEIWTYGDTNAITKINTQMRGRPDENSEVPRGDTYDINIEVDGTSQNISFYLQEITRAYQDLGLSGITLETDTGLTEELYYDFVINGTPYSFQAEPDVDAEKEETDVTTPRDTLRSLDGKYFVLNSQSGDHYVWYHLDAAPADVYGSVDMSSGYDWKDDSKNFVINYKNEGDVNILIDVNTSNSSAIRTAINSKFSEKSLNSKVEAYNTQDDYIGIRTKNADGDETFTITAGTKDFLEVVGITPGTYTGTYSTNGYEEINLNNAGVLTNESGLTVGQTYDIDFTLNGVNRTTSFYLQEETSGYQELGFVGEDPDESSGLGVGTFDFNLSVDGQTSQNHSIVMEPDYPAEVVGTVDMTSGYDWYDYREYMNISVNGAESFQIPFESNFPTITDIVNHINTVFTTNTVDSEIEAFESGLNIGIRTLTNGAAQSFNLSTGDPDAIGTLGLSTGTYTGIDATSGYEDINLGGLATPSNDSGLARGQTYDISATIDGATQTPSFYLQETTQGYQELGLTSITLSTDTALDVGDYDVNTGINGTQTNTSFTIQPATPASVLGTTDLTSGHNWQNDNKSFVINIGSDYTINLTQNNTSLTDIVGEINSEFSLNSITEIEAFESDTNIGIRTTSTGSSSSFTVVSGDALSILGLNSGTYTGIDATSGYEDINLNGLASPSEESGLTVGQTYDISATVDGATQTPSFYLQEEIQGYQELGLTGITSSTDSGLTQNTTYYYSVNSTEYNITTPADTEAVSEATEVTTSADASQSLSGTYWNLNDPSGNNYYVWYSLEESQAQPASHVGSADLSTGADFTSPKDFTINVNNGSDVQVTLNTSTSDVVTTVTEVNTQLSNSGVTGIEAFDASPNVGIRTTSSGSNQTFTLATGTDDALTVLGWTASTYTGVDATYSTEPTQTGEGIQVDIVENDDANTIASKTASVVNSHAAFNAVSNTDIVTVTNVDAGSVVDATDGNAGVTINVTTQGDETIPANLDWSVILNLLNTATSGFTWSIEGDDVRLTSDSLGSSSVVDITSGTTGTDLISSLSAQIESAVDGLDADDTTYQGVLDKLNANTSGATWSIESGDIRLLSNSTGSSSTISLANGTNDLVAQLNHIQTTQFIDTYVGEDATRGDVEGTVDISTGYDFLNKNETLVVDSTDYVLSDNTTSIAEVVSHINSLIPAELEAYADSPYVGIRTTSNGSTETFELSGVTSLGLASGVYTGTDKTDTTWQNILGLLNDNTSGAVWNLEGDDVRLTSDSYGSGSTISLTAGTNDFLAAVSSTPNTPVSGLDADPKKYSDIISRLNENTSGATWSITGGNIRLTSDSLGSLSAISLANGTNDLVAQLNNIQTTQFVNTYNGIDSEPAEYISNSSFDGHDFTDKREPIYISGTPYTLNATTTSLSEVVAHMDSRLPFSLNVFSDGNYVRIETRDAGSSQSFSIDSGEAATTLGIELGTYTGIDKTDNSWSNIISLLNDATTQDANWSLESGDVRLTSNSTSSSSTILLSAGTNDLLSNLGASLETGVPGLDADDTTYQGVIDKLNANTSGSQWSMENGNIRLTSDSKGQFSTVSLSNGTTNDIVAQLTDIQTTQFINTYNGEDATRGNVEGTVDMSTGYDFTDKREDLIIDSIIYTLDATTTTLTEVATLIDSKLPESLESFESGSNVGIRTVASGLTETFEVSTSEAATTLGFTAASYAGHDQSVDPAASGTGIQVDILENELAEDVAQKTQTAIDAVAAFTATVTGNKVSIIDNELGAVEDAHDVDSGVVIDIANQGVTFVAGDQSWENVLSRLNNATSGEYTWEIVDGDVRVYNDIYGSSSTILLEPGTTRDFLSNISGFTSLKDPVDGFDEDPRTYQDIVNRLNALTTVNGTWDFYVGDIILRSNSTGPTSTVDITPGTTNDLMSNFKHIEDEDQGFFKQRVFKLKNGVDFYLDETFPINSFGSQYDNPYVDYKNRIAYLHNSTYEYIVLKINEDGTYNRMSNIYLTYSDSEIVGVSNGYILTARSGEDFYLGYETADPIDNFGMIKLFEHKDDHLRELFTMLPHEFPEIGGGYGLGDGTFFIDEKNNLLLGESNYGDGVVFEYEIPVSNEPNIYIQDLRLARTTRTLPDMNENIQVFTTPLHLPLNTTSNVENYSIYSEDETIAIYDAGWIKPVSKGNTNIVLESQDAAQEVFKLNLNVNDTRILTNNWDNNSKRKKFYQDDGNNVSYGDTVYIYDGDVYVADPDYNGLAGDGCGVIYVYSEDENHEMFLNGKYEGDTPGMRFGNTIEITESDNRKILVSNNGSELTIMREKFGVFSIVQKISVESNTTVRIKFDKMVVSTDDDFWAYSFDDETSAYELLQHEVDIDFNGIVSSIKRIFLFDDNLYIYGNQTYIAKHYQYNTETNKFDFVKNMIASIEDVNSAMTQQAEEISPHLLGSATFMTKELKTDLDRIPSTTYTGTMFSIDDYFYYSNSESRNNSNVDYNQGFNFVQNNFERNILFHDRPIDTSQTSYYFSLDKVVFSPKDGSIYIFNIDYVKVDSFEIYIDEYPDVNGLKSGHLGVRNVLPEDAYYKSFYFSSSDESVAYIEPDGTIRPVSEGSITITATSIDGNAASTTTLDVRRSGGIDRVDLVDYNLVQYLNANGQSGFKLEEYDTVNDLYYAINYRLLSYRDSHFVTHPNQNSIMSVYEKSQDNFVLKYMIPEQSSSHDADNFSGNIDGMLSFTTSNRWVMYIRNGEYANNPNIPNFNVYHLYYTNVETLAEEYGVNVYPYYIEYIDEENYTYQNRISSGNNSYFGSYGSSKNKAIAIGHYNFYGTFGYNTGCVHVLYHDPTADEFIYNQHIEGDTSYEKYGWSMDGDDGDYMFVGAPGKNKLYIYKWSDSQKEYVEQEIIQGYGPEYGYYVQYFNQTNKFYVFRQDGTFDTYIFNGSDWVYEQTFNFMNGHVSLNTSRKIKYFETSEYRVMMNGYVYIFNTEGFLLKTLDSQVYYNLFVDGNNIYVSDQYETKIIKIEYLDDSEIEYYYNNFLYQDIDVEFENIKNSFKVPTVGIQGATIEWVSNNPSIQIDNDFATVTRPDPGLSDVSVDLTANIILLSGLQFSKTLSTTVKAYSDKEIVDMDYNSLNVGYQGYEYDLQVGSDITLQPVGETGETTITWTSSHPNITNTGVVTRQTTGSGWAVGTIVATITRGDVSRNKTFELTVVEEGEVVKNNYVKLGTPLDSGFYTGELMSTYGDYLVSKSTDTSVFNLYRYDGSLLVNIESVEVGQTINYIYISKDKIVVIDSSNDLIIYSYDDSGILKLFNSNNGFIGSYPVVFDNSSEVEVVFHNNNEYVWYIYGFSESNGLRLINSIEYDRSLLNNPSTPHSAPTINSKYFVFTIRDNQNNSSPIFIYDRVGSGFRFHSFFDTYNEVGTSYDIHYNNTIRLVDNTVYVTGATERLYKIEITSSGFEYDYIQISGYSLIDENYQNNGYNTSIDEAGIYLGSIYFGDSTAGYETSTGSVFMIDSDLSFINNIPNPDNVEHDEFGEHVSYNTSSNFIAVKADSNKLYIIDKERVFYEFSEYSIDSFKPLDVVKGISETQMTNAYFRQAVASPYIYSFLDSGNVGVYKVNGSNIDYVKEISGSFLEYNISADGMYVAISTSSNTIEVYKNDGSDNFTSIFETTGSQLYARTSEINGNYLFIGCGNYGNQNKVEIYKNDGLDNFTLIQTIDSPDGTDNRLFGSKIKSDGDRIVIADRGAYGSTSNMGKIYIYKNNGLDVFELEADFYASDQATIYFGSDIDIDGDYVVATSKDDTIIYHHNGSTWERFSRIHNNNHSSVSISGNLLFIGDFYYSHRSALGAETGSSYGLYNCGRLQAYYIVDDIKKENLLSDYYIGFSSFGSSIQLDGDQMLITSNDTMTLYDVTKTEKTINTVDVFLNNETSMQPRSSGIDVKLLEAKFPSYSIDEISLSSLDETIATVDQEGMVSYASEGTASIRATSGSETFDLDITTIDDSVKTETWSDVMYTSSFETEESIDVIKRSNRIFQMTVDGIHIYNNDSGDWVFEQRIYSDNYYREDYSLIDVSDDATYLAFVDIEQFVNVYKYNGTMFTQLIRNQLGGIVYSVAISNDILILGNPYDNTVGSNNGIIKIYENDGNDNFILDQEIPEFNTSTTSQYFGRYIKIYNDKIYVSNSSKTREFVKDQYGDFGISKSMNGVMDYMSQTGIIRTTANEFYSTSFIRIPHTQRENLPVMFDDNFYAQTSLNTWVDNFDIDIAETNYTNISFPIVPVYIRNADIYENGFIVPHNHGLMIFETLIVPMTSFTLKSEGSADLNGPSAAKVSIDTFEPIDANTPFLSYESLDTNIATVDNFGNVSPVSTGQATIRATSRDGSNITQDIVVDVVQTTGLNFGAIGQYFIPKYSIGKTASVGYKLMTPFINQQTNRPGFIEYDFSGEEIVETEVEVQDQNIPPVESSMEISAFDNRLMLSLHDSQDYVYNVFFKFEGGEWVEKQTIKIDEKLQYANNYWYFYQRQNADMSGDYAVINTRYHDTTYGWQTKVFAYKYDSVGDTWSSCGNIPPDQSSQFTVGLYEDKIFRGGDGNASNLKMYKNTSSCNWQVVQNETSVGHMSRLSGGNGFIATNYTSHSYIYFYKVDANSVTLLNSSSSYNPSSLGAIRDVEIKTNNVYMLSDGKIGAYSYDETGIVSEQGTVGQYLNNPTAEKLHVSDDEKLFIVINNTNSIKYFKFL